MSLAVGRALGVRAAAAVARPALPAAVAARSGLFAAAAAAAPSAARCVAIRSLHSAAPLQALFGSSSDATPPATPAAPAEAQRLTEEEQAAENFRQYTKLMLSRVTLNEYELQLKRTVQEAPPPGASLRERAATWLQRKTAEATSQEMPGAAVAKPQLKMLSELTPEEKAKPSLIGSAVKERVAAKTGLPASEVTLMLCRFDHLLASSEWFRWRRANGKPLPTNYMQMYDMMKEDRRSGTGMPRVDKNEMRMKPKKHGRR